MKVGSEIHSSRAWIRIPQAQSQALGLYSSSSSAFLLPMAVLSMLLVAVYMLGAPISGLLITNAAKADGSPLNIWWPTEGSHVQGTQPLKAMIEGMSTEQYEMYWRVDGGQLNQMYNSPQDYPHKEAWIDLSGWTWKGVGPYAMTFVAKKGSDTIMERTINIYNDGAASVPVQTVTAQPTAASGPAVIQNTTAETSAPAPVQPTPSFNGKVDVWWPTQNATLAGVQPFKALLTNASVDQYDMYWQVDGGQLSLMPTNTTDYPHKETSVDVSGWNWQTGGNYTLTFVAKDKQGSILAQTAVPVLINPSSSAAQTASVQKTEQSPAASAVASGNPLGGMRFYVNPNSSAARQANEWRSSRPGDASAMDYLAAQATAQWLGGWSGDVGSAARQVVSQAAQNGSVPVLVAYNIPFRDCGGYSAGGATSRDAYLSWIRSLAGGIGGNSAIVILEPDGLSTVSCLSGGDQQMRKELLSQATSILKSNGNTRVYIDAGHSGWIDAGVMAQDLKASGIDAADGFALNVSNFMPTADEISYGTKVSQNLGGKHFVIDTARNGNGSSGEWCNPSGRASGQKPTAATGNPLVDAFLWLKVPGESDGNCNGGPSAGAWWPEYALGLVQRSSYR